jgi:WS/DGAT/MGAT family acyltransferase
VPLDKVKATRRAYGVNFTDVVLAAVSGSLRSWLADRGELPAKPLVVGVPVSVDDALDASRLVGNRVSTLITTLATDIADPVARIRRIHDVAEEARTFQDTLGKDMMERWTQLTPPKPFAALMRAYSRFKIADHHPPPINLVVSNVPGPREELEIAGAKLVDLFSVGPVLEGIGLNITVWSYLDRMNFSGIACPDSLPDLRGLLDRIEPALDELLAAAPVTTSASAAQATTQAS